MGITKAGLFQPQPVGPRAPAPALFSVIDDIALQPSVGFHWQPGCQRPSTQQPRRSEDK